MPDRGTFYTKRQGENAGPSEGPGNPGTEGVIEQEISKVEMVFETDKGTSGNIRGMAASNFHGCLKIPGHFGPDLRTGSQS